MKMSIPLKSLSIFCLSASVMLFGEVSKTEYSPLEMLARATASVQSQDPDTIRDAYAEAARYISEPTPEVWNKLPRREKLVFSLCMLDGISSCIGKSKGPEEAYLTVGAPGVHMAGTDPKHIADPEVRKEYERRIADNNQKIERIRAQSLFQILKTTWTQRVQYLAAQHYGKDFNDQREIKSILDSIVSDMSLRTELMESLGINGK